MTLNNHTSVLIIGATGALGLQLLRRLSKTPEVNEVHVLARTPSKLSDTDRSLISSIYQGDAKGVADVENALRATKANYVILATGNGQDTSQSDTREATGKALSSVLLKPDFSHVHAVIASSHGASETKIIVGFGIGTLIAHHLRHVLKDHTLQEAQFDNPALKNRTLIVRPSSLTDNKALGDLDKIVGFDGTKKGPTIGIDRADVALWIAHEIAKPIFVGRKVCLTNAN